MNACARAVFMGQIQRDRPSLTKLSPQNQFGTLAIRPQHEDPMQGCTKGTDADTACPIHTVRYALPSIASDATSAVVDTQLGVHCVKPLRNRVLHSSVSAPGLCRPRPLPPLTADSRIKRQHYAVPSTGIMLEGKYAMAFKVQGEMLYNEVITFGHPTASPVASLVAISAAAASASRRPRSSWALDICAVDAHRRDTWEAAQSSLFRFHGGSSSAGGVNPRLRGRALRLR